MYGSRYVHGMPGLFGSGCVWKMLRPGVASLLSISIFSIIRLRSRRSLLSRCRFWNSRKRWSGLVMVSRKSSHGDGCSAGAGVTKRAAASVARLIRNPHPRSDMMILLTWLRPARTDRPDGTIISLCSAECEAASVRSAPEDVAQSLGDDALLPLLQHEHRDQDPPVPCPVDPADQDRRVALRQLLRHLLRRGADALLVPGDLQVRHLVGDGRHDLLALHARDLLHFLLDDADASLIFAPLGL